LRANLRLPPRVLAPRLGAAYEHRGKSVDPTRTRFQVVVVDPALDTAALLSQMLASEGVSVSTVPTAEEALDKIRQLRPQIVLAEHSLPGSSGIELMEQVLAADPGLDFILLTADHSEELAMDVIRRGASDCLLKPLDAHKLKECMRKLLSQAEVRHKTAVLDHELLDVYQFEGMVGRSPLMLDVFAKVRRISPHFRTVMVTGATGTGKELVAHALHKLSPVSSAPFAVCNCSALVETLLESELFGYVKGAFTGANQDKRGIFEYANGGTVFLDEVGELPLPAQAKLLRVLQNNEVQRVGSPVPHRVDVRIIAATHRDLRKMVAQGQFREDLFYRLSVVEISVPRLSQRREDLPLLQRHFLEKYSRLYKKEVLGITRRGQARLASHHWPGNVRELENVISSSCIMAVGRVIDLQDLPELFRAMPGESAPEAEELLSLDELQRRHLLRVLNLVQGNKARAAEILGVGRNTIYQMLGRYRGGQGGHSSAPNKGNA